MDETKAAMVHKVVSDTELEMATEEGWQLKQVLTETVSDVHCDLVAHPLAGQTASGYNNDVISVSTGFERTVHRYLLERTVDTAIVELKDYIITQGRELKEAQKTATVAAKELEVALQARETAEARVVQLNAEVVAQAKAAVAHQAVADDAIKQQGRVEEALDIVRQEIGTQEMKRILGNPEQGDQTLDELIREMTPGG